MSRRYILPKVLQPLAARIPLRIPLRRRGKGGSQLRCSDVIAKAQFGPFEEDPALENPGLPAASEVGKRRLLGLLEESDLCEWLVMSNNILRKFSVVLSIPPSSQAPEGEGLQAVLPLQKSISIISGHCFTLKHVKSSTAFV